MPDRPVARRAASPGYRPGEQEQIAAWIAEHGEPRRYGYAEQGETRPKRNRMSKERQVLAAMKSRLARAERRAAE